MEALSSREELKQRNEDLNILITFIQTVHNSSKLEEIYRVALDSVVELENVDIACIYLVNEIGNEAVMQDHRNFPEGFARKDCQYCIPELR